MIDGKDLYLAHVDHLNIRRRTKDKTFFVDECPACQMHKEANEKASRESYTRRVDRAWERHEQR